MSTLAVAVDLLAGGEAKKSGPLGFAIILVLCVACYFLFKSMSRHLRKVREEFPDGSAPGAPPAADGRSTPPGASTAPGERPPHGTDP